MVSFYYICDVEPKLVEQILDDYEEELGFIPVWIEINKAIDANRKILNVKENEPPRWTQRELFVLELIKQELFN
jgi:hypothetical protein